MISRRQVLALSLFLSFALQPMAAISQAKPPDSTTKIKRVLLYNKIGGWFHTYGSVYVRVMIEKHAAAKGFELVQLDTDSLITLDFLNRFQVIIWNNNSNGSASVPSAIARKAVIDYMHQGGGWMLIHCAGDHGDTWPDLAAVLGTKLSHWNEMGKAELLRDSAATLHKELKYMVSDMSEIDTLYDEWQAYTNTIRPLPNFTVVATSRALPGSTHKIVSSPLDGSNDNVYIWAREVGQGRLIFNSIGHGRMFSPQTYFSHQDSLVSEMYWQNLRYAAGDFENGCTDPSSVKYSPSARIDDGSCSSASVLANRAKALGDLGQIGRRFMFSQSLPLAISLQLRNMGGKLVWQKTLAQGSRELFIDESVLPGIYHLTAHSNLSISRYRLLIP